MWEAHRGPVWKLAWAHPQFGHLIASASFDRTVGIWEEQEGFLQQVVMEKWNAFGQRVWLAHRALDLAYLVPVALNALWLKEDPEAALTAYWLPITTLAMSILLRKALTMRSSIVPSQMRSMYVTEFFCPILWARSSL